MIRRILDSNFVAFLVIALASASLYLLYSKGREQETLIGIALLFISLIFLWWGNRPKRNDAYEGDRVAAETKARETKALRIPPESAKPKKPQYQDPQVEKRKPGKEPIVPSSDRPRRQRPVERYRSKTGREGHGSVRRRVRRPIERIRIDQPLVPEGNVIDAVRK